MVGEKNRKIILRILRLKVSKCYVRCEVACKRLVDSVFKLVAVILMFLSSLQNRWTTYCPHTIDLGRVSHTIAVW